MGVSRRERGPKPQDLERGEAAAGVHKVFDLKPEGDRHSLVDSN